MKNWKDFVGLQPVSGELGKGGHSIFVLECKKNEESSLSFTITRHSLKKKDFKYTEDTIGDAVEDLVLSFPKYEYWQNFHTIVEDSKEWKFGFGPYYTYKDGESIYHDNCIKVINPFSIRKIDITVLFDGCNEEECKLIEEAAKNEPKFSWTHFYIPLPYFKIDSKLEKFISLQFDRIKNTIARNSRRGRGNKKIKSGDKTVVFYSNSEYDNPIFVSEYNGKYAIMKHPNFENYGYVVQNYEI